MTKSKWRKEFSTNGLQKTRQDQLDALTLQKAVNISDSVAFSKEMETLLEIENEIPYEKIKFEDLNLQTAKVKDLIKLEFLFD